MSASAGHTRAIGTAIGAALIALTVPAKADDAIFTFPFEASARLWDPPNEPTGLHFRAPVAGRLYGLMGGFQAYMFDRKDPDELTWGFYCDFAKGRFSFAPADAQPDQKLLEVGFPALSMGFFVAKKRFLARAGVDTGWAFDWSGPSYVGSSPFVHAPLAVCVLSRAFYAKKGFGRQGTDACITVTGILWEWSLFEGVSLGAQVDL